MTEAKRRCRDCKWWRVRTGCVNPDLVGRATAFTPAKSWVRTRTKCLRFEARG